MRLDINTEDKRELAKLIRAYILQDNLIRFYKSEEWLELRAEVLEEYHGECAICAEHGKVTQADVVHHVNEVRKRPELALSKYYIDKNGQKKRQLIPLCNACHNMVHPEKGNGLNKGTKKQYTNEERWD